MGPPDEVSVSFDGTQPHQRHPGPPPMQPFNPLQAGGPPAWSSPGQVPFMSFSQYGNTGNTYAPPPPTASYSGGGFDFRDEPPLLEGEVLDLHRLKSGPNEGRKEVGSFKLLN
jgi:hypothetical protein